MEDDPFERSLQSNHELKEDEVKRKKGRGEVKGGECGDPEREQWQNTREKETKISTRLLAVYTRHSAETRAHTSSLSPSDLVV